MLPSSPPSSPSRPALINLTNDEREPSIQIISPPRERKRAPAAEPWTLGSRKRVKISDERRKTKSRDEGNDSDDDDRVAIPVRRVQRAATVYGMRHAMMTGPSFSRVPHLPTHAILQSFVSSNKSDVFKCHSIHDGAYMSPPYACAYSNSAKAGNKPLLAVSTEQGAIHVLDTSKRNEWDVEPPRCTFQPHHNGVFDVQWSRSDTLLATAAADQTVGVSKLAPDGAKLTYSLAYHQSTVKCVTWDPTRDGDVLCSGSRDGMICIWDLRDSGRCKEGKPVLVVSKAHDTGKSTVRKGKLHGPPSRGVTSLLFSGTNEYGLISGGSYDGILRQWDFRYIDNRRKSKRKDPNWVNAIPKPSHMSTIDPTTYNNTRRARGITSLTQGSGPSRGLIFALANDSRVHTYDLASLEPLSGQSDDSSTDSWSYAHDNMRTNSFYVRVAPSPCGRWLASGGAANGSVFLFDVSCSTREREAMARCGGDAVSERLRGVELHGQRGEVGAVDWAEDMLATCADDGTVRVWRPDLETSRTCQSVPEEMRWGWSWAVGL